MPTLANATYAMAVLNAHGFTFQKRYGQNFLIDENILFKIIDEAEITSEDYVLEIGPGIGTMTQILAQRAKHVFAVEIDKMLIPILEDTLSAYKNITIINEDILKVDINRLVAEECEGRPVKVVANLPYYITTPIIMELFESKIPMESCCVMVQKEVADRMQVGPGTKDYGALSLAVAYYSEAHVICKVPATCFYPRPKVDSAVIKLTLHVEPPVKAVDEDFMFRVIRASFNQRRKTLANGLKNSPDIPINKEDIEDCIMRLGKGAAVRGETLTLEEFCELSNMLLEKK